MKYFILFISIFIVYQFSSKAQYSSENKDLVYTTYTRQFNKKIERKYLHSNDKEKTRAALLSLAQSEDTVWVNEITKLKFKKYPEYICFTLGELGKCKRSANYLLSKLSEDSFCDKITHDIIQTLGKVGDLNTYNSLINSYNTADQNKLDGISLALYNFYFRKIGEKDKSISILANELSKYKFPGRRNFEAAFALYRMGGSSKLNEKTIKYIRTYFNEDNSLIRENKLSEITIAYLLGCLRQNKCFPNDKILFNNLLNTNGFTIKIAAIQAMVYFPYSTKEELESYLDLIKDKNPNIGRELAASVKNLRLNEKLKPYLKNFLVNGIEDMKNSLNIRGELFLSYLKLFKPDFEKIKKEYEKIVPKKYFYEGCGFYNTSVNALDLLLNKFPEENERDKIAVLESALNFQKNEIQNEKLNRLIINSLSSNSLALISVAADGIDSLYIQSNKDKLVNIIARQINNHKNDPDYLESLMSLSNLAGKIDKKLNIEILKRLSSSDEYSVKKFAYKQLGISTQHLIKSDKYFSKIWSDAFKYKYAEIFTPKGNFKIEFLPAYAPVSVGNFCSLAKKKFFNNNIFHRVVPGFVIQGGDPDETGWGGPGYDIVSEFSPLNYNIGMVGMASAGKDTEGSQWFVTTGTYPHLNGRYTIFAITIKNIDVVENIDQGNKILKINLFP
jgi:cyclophilin family peptidyl-prolyl cis-trans isomerase